MRSKGSCSVLATDLGQLSSFQGPIDTRMSLSVGNPTAAVMRRTCLFLPSVKVNSNHVSGTVLRTRMGGTRSGHAGR